MRGAAVISDPQGAAEIYRSRYQIACEAFSSGEITDRQFQAELYRLGYRGQELTAETALYSRGDVR